MHICPCTPNTEGFQVYTVNLAFTFNNLVRDYAPNLNSVVDCIAVNPEEFRGLPDRNVLLFWLALLCALCTALSHTGDTRALGPGPKALRALIEMIEPVAH